MTATRSVMADLDGLGEGRVSVGLESAKDETGDAGVPLEGRSKVGQQEVVKLEEYKAFIEDTSRYSDRRQTVSNIYVAVNALLLSAAAVVLGGGSLEGWRFLAVAPLLFVGVIASIVWLILVHKYEGIIGKRVAQLREIETAIPGSHRMYARMDEAFCGEVPSFSSIEKVLPSLFILLDGVVLLAVLGLGLTSGRAW